MLGYSIALNVWQPFYFSYSSNKPIRLLDFSTWKIVFIQLYSSSHASSHWRAYEHIMSQTVVQFFASLSLLAEPVPFSSDSLLWIREKKATEKQNSQQSSHTHTSKIIHHVYMYVYAVREKEGVRMNKGLVLFRFSLAMLSGLDMNLVLMQTVELPIAIFTSIFFPGRYRRDNTGGKIKRCRLLRQIQISHHRAVRKRF